MNKRDNIINDMEAYFLAGCKKDQVCFGLEAEHFVVSESTGQEVGYEDVQGVESLLHTLLPQFTDAYYENGRLLGVSNGTADISLEPGSQLEISVVQSNDISEIEKNYTKYYAMIEAALKNRGQALLAQGYLPKASAAGQPLLPKARYYFMDEHFKNAGTMGVNMMRGTASCQVSFDYTSQEDFIDKYRCACLVSPVLALMTSNAPVFEQKKNTNPLIRTHIWQNVDSQRTGILPATFDEDFSFKKYAEFVLSQKAIFELIDGNPVKSDRTVLEVLTEVQGTQYHEAMLLYMSLVFPDVRLRQYIELRIADSLPPADTIAYAAFLKGLFEDAAGLKTWLAQFPQSCEAIRQAQEALMANGFEALVYGMPAKDFIRELLRLAVSQLKDSEKTYVRKGFAQYEL